MPIAMRHHDNPMPSLTALSGFSVALERDAERMATLQGRSADEIQRRFEEGHRAYVARIAGDAAAWGWVATSRANIGELNSAFAIPHGDRYLWNFVTLPAYRGHGIYPRFLQSIMHAEAAGVTRFWIAYAPENHTSGAGIAKAGFTTLADISFDADGRPALRDLLPGGATLASTILGLPATSARLTPCWRCVRAGRGAMACAEGTCQCDYQRPTSGCAMQA